MDKPPPRGEKDSVLTVENDLSGKQAMEDLEHLDDGLEESLRTRNTDRERAGKEMDTSEKSLEERLKFETLLAELSAHFINLPADRIDSEIEDAQRRICEFLALDRSTLWQVTEKESDMLRLTHMHPAPGSLISQVF